MCVIHLYLSYLCLRFWRKTESAKQISHSRKQWTFIMADSKFSKPLKLKAGCSCGWCWTWISFLCQLCQVCTDIIHQRQDQWWRIHAGWVRTSNTSNLELGKIIKSLHLVLLACNISFNTFTLYMCTYINLGLAVYLEIGNFKSNGPAVIF